jgi:hypothetical protein
LTRRTSSADRQTLCDTLKSIESRLSKETKVNWATYRTEEFS